MAGLVESIKILMTGDSSGLEKEMQKAERSLKKLERDFRDVAQVAAFTGAAIAGFGTLMVREAAKYDAGVSGAVKRMTQAYSAFAVEVGQALMPVLRVLGDAMSAVTNALRSMDPETKRMVATALALSSALAAVLAGGTGLYATFLKLLPIIAPVAGALLGVVAAVAAIVAVASVLRAAWDNNWFGMQETVRQTWEYLRDGWKSFWDWLKGGLKLVGDLIVFATLEPIRKVLDGLAKITGNGALEALRDTIADMERRGISGVFDDMASGLKTMAEVAKPVAKQIKAAFIANLSDVKKFLMGLFDGLDFKTPSPGMSLEKKKFFQAYKPKEYGQNFASNAPKALGGPKQVTWNAHVGAFLTEQLRGLGNAARASADMLLTSMGGIGSLLSRAIQNFSGILEDNPLEDGDLQINWSNFWNAIGQIIVELLQAAPGFERVISIALGVLKSVAAALDPLAVALQKLVAAVGLVLDAVVSHVAPVFEILGGVLEDLGPILKIVAVSMITTAPLFRLIGSILSILRPILFVLFEVLKGVTTAILWVATRMVELANTVMRTINIGGIFDAVIAENERIIAENNAAIAELSAMTFDSAKASVDEAAARYENIGAMEKQQRTIEEVTESLTNVPAGYKVAAARFGATNPMVDGNFLKNSAMPNDPSVNVTVYVGGKQVAAEVEKQTSYRVFQRSGAVTRPTRAW